MVNQQAINAVAWAIFYFEGGNQVKSSVRNVRNNNPGNLRAYAPGQAVDRGGYRIFATPNEGWYALQQDILTKVTNRLGTVETMLDFFNIYAPAEDHNNPHGYAQFVLQWVNLALGKHYGLDSTIGEIFF